MRNYQRDSKYLSLLLRHKPEAADLTLDAQGWVAIEDVVRNTRLTEGDIRYIVAKDDKQRYAIEDGMVRANQGHSIKVELGLPESVPPDILYHGTKEHFLKQIFVVGLLPKSRHDVHLSENLEEARHVADRRKGLSKVLIIDAKQMHADGVVFKKSANGVWLTSEVNPKYLKENI